MFLGTVSVEACSSVLYGICGDLQYCVFGNQLILKYVLRKLCFLGIRKCLLFFLGIRESSSVLLKYIYCVTRIHSSAVLFTGQNTSKENRGTSRKERHSSESCC